jgi:hypothetical protein
MNREKFLCVFSRHTSSSLPANHQCVLIIDFRYRNFFSSIACSAMTTLSLGHHNAQMIGLANNMLSHSPR